MWNPDKQNERETGADIASDSREATKLVAAMSDADQAKVGDVVQWNLWGGSFRDPSGGASA